MGEVAPWEPTLRPVLPKTLIDGVRGCVEAGMEPDHIGCMIGVLAGLKVMADELPGDELVERCRMMSQAMNEAANV